MLLRGPRNVLTHKKPPQSWLTVTQKFLRHFYTLYMKLVFVFTS